MSKVVQVTAGLNLLSWPKRRSLQTWRQLSHCELIASSMMHLQLNCCCYALVTNMQSFWGARQLRNSRAGLHFRESASSFAVSAIPQTHRPLCIEAMFALGSKLDTVVCSQTSLDSQGVHTSCWTSFSSDRASCFLFQCSYFSCLSLNSFAQKCP